MIHYLNIELTELSSWILQIASLAYLRQKELLTEENYLYV